MTEIEYYGTNTVSAGHGLYILKDGDTQRNLTRFGELPFNPEQLPWAGRKREYIVGTVRFYNFAGFTICAISGSCSDDRGGSKSIFFTEEDLTPRVFKEKLEQNIAFKKIIAKMPFEVKWPNL